MKLEKDIVFIDVDTTGLSHTNDRIVKLNLAKITTDGEVIDGSRTINPGINIPQETTDIHGVTNEDVVDQPRFENIVDSLYQFISDCDIAGYSVKKFDLPLLVEHFHRANKPLDLSNVNIIDLRDLYMLKEPRTLVGAFAHYVNDEFPDSDAKAMVGIYNAQMNKYEDLPSSISDLAEILNDESEVDIAAKFKKTDTGRIIFNFGKYSDKTIEYVEQNDPSYLKWMLDSDYFTADTKSVIKKQANIG